jgi:peptidylprolyl isomerase
VVKPTVSLPATLPTSLVVTDLKQGTGTAVKACDTLTVNYIGVLSRDGTMFDNSYDKGQPITFQIGAGHVIPGWDQGLIGVKAGGRRQLDIPASLAYGDQGSGTIIQPGDALSFIIDVISIQPGQATGTTDTTPVTTPVTTTGHDTGHDNCRDDIRHLISQGSSPCTSGLPTSRH